MPFPSAITSPQQTQLRQTEQQFKQALLTTPFEIVWQAEVNTNTSGYVYAEFAWANASGSYGDYTDVHEGMTVFITNSAGSTVADFLNPVLRGRARKAPTATTFYIQENGVMLTTSMYVTVVADYDLWERAQKVDEDTGQIFKDWGIAYVPPPPYIAEGLQSVYVDDTGDATVSIAFAPTVRATANNATIASYNWIDIGDGTITVGSATDKDVTIQFPGVATARHRWVRFEFTDSNGITGYFVFEVYTIELGNSDCDDVLLFLGSDGANVDCNWIEGPSTSKRLREDATGILPNSRVTLVSFDNYGGTTTPINTNIMMVGRLRQEVVEMQAERELGRVSEVEFTIQGLGQQLGQLNTTPLAIVDADSPDNFLEIDEPTPRRAVMYALLWHSTYPTLSACVFDSDIDYYVDKNFRMDDVSSLLGLVNQQAGYVNSEASFAYSGETAFKRQVNYMEPSDRSGVTAVMVILSIDRMRWSLSYDPKPIVSEVIVGATSYNTTSKERAAYYGKCPPEGLGAGHEPDRLDGRILKSDQSEATDQASVLYLVGNHYSAVQPKRILTVDFFSGGYYWINPVQWQYYRFTITAAENVRGVGFSSADNWLCTSISTEHDGETGERYTRGIFEEVSSHHPAGQYAAPIPVNVPVTEPNVSPTSVYPADPDNPLVNYPTNDPDTEWESSYSGPTLTAQGPIQDAVNDQQMPAINQEVLQVPLFASNSVQTTNDTQVGETYYVRVQNFGLLEPLGSWQHDFDFTIDQQGWELAQGPGLEARGKYTAGVGFEKSNTGIRIWRNIDGVMNCNYLRSTYDTTGTGTAKSWGQGWGQQVSDEMLDDPKVYQFQSYANGTNQTVVVSGTLLECNRLAVSMSSNDDTVTLHTIRAEGTGQNPFGSGGSNVRYGDAFYDWESADAADVYAAGKGLLIDGAKPGTVPAYNSNHDYVFAITGTGSPFSFQFVDPDADYADNDRIFLVVTVDGPGMNPSVLP